jgi:hypothetical protein
LASAGKNRHLSVQPAAPLRANGHRPGLARRPLDRLGNRRFSTRLLLDLVPMRNAIFYLTYNGLYNFTNGIGTQTQLLISGLEALREILISQYGSIDVHVVCPSPDAQTWGYDHAFFQRQQGRLARLDGHVHFIPYKREPTQDLWEIPSWKALCQNVAPLLHSQTAAYERSLIKKM